MELMLIRHAHPGPIPLQDSVADPHLDREGEDQARALARFLAGSPYGTVTRLMSSTMTRARQTAQPLEGALGLTLETDPRIVEVDSTWKTYGVAIDGYPTRRAAWDDMNRGRLGDNRFDPEEFASGVTAAIDDIAGECNDTDRTAIVCHGGVISVYLARILGISRTFFVDCTYTSVSRVLAYPDGFREVRSINEVPHLINDGSLRA